MAPPIYKHTVEFPRAKGKPIAVDVSLLSMLPGTEEYRVIVGVKGMQHPFITTTFNITDDRYNPAVIPAGHALRELIEKVMVEQVEKQGLATARITRKNEGEKANKALWVDGGYSLHMDFNPQPHANYLKHDHYTGPVSQEQLEGFAQSIVQAVQEAAPRIEQLLVDNAHLEPDPHSLSQAIEAQETYDAKTAARLKDVNNGGNTFTPRTSWSEGGGPNNDKRRGWDTPGG